MRNLGRVPELAPDIDITVSTNEANCMVAANVAGIAQSLTLDLDSWDKLADIIKAKIADQRRGDAPPPRIIVPGQG